jgi:hypothetical protein
MELSYAAKHIWRKPTTEEPEVLYSKKNVKRIRSTLTRLIENEVSATYEPLSQEFLSWFNPLYTDLIGKKRNANVHDLYTKTLGNPTPAHEFWCLTVSMGSTRLGGAIIFSNAERLMIAYRAFLPKWPHGSLQASPSLYAEYVIAKTAYDLGKQQISHGKDRNLYGINSDIGQLIYKLSVGYRPQLPLPTTADAQQMCTIDTTTIHEDAVILHYPQTGDKITEATLVTARDTEEKYAQLVHYPELLKVTTVYRD